MVNLLAVVKAAEDYGVDISAIWDGARFILLTGAMLIAITAGIIFYRKLVSA